MTALRRGRRTQRYQAFAEDFIPAAWHSPWTPTEAEFTELFLEVADAKGWTPRYHTHDSRRSEPGFPDWVIVHTAQKRIVFIELKGFGGIASQEQRDFLAAINAAGGEGYLVTTTRDYARDVAAFGQLLSARPAR